MLKTNVDRLLDLPKVSRRFPNNDSKRKFLRSVRSIDQAYCFQLIAFTISKWGWRSNPKFKASPLTFQKINIKILSFVHDNSDDVSKDDNDDDDENNGGDNDRNI